MLVFVLDDMTDVEARFCRPFRCEAGTRRIAVKFASSAPDALDVIEAADERNMVRTTCLDLPLVISTSHANAGTRRRELPRPVDCVALRAEVERRLERRRAGAR